MGLGMELLAPVNGDTLEAALSSGADAVYFGLRRLNARRGARNFSQSDLPAVVERIHQCGAKAHLAINIDLAQNEVALAARMLQLARQCGVDAVIVRDPAILAMRRFFPGMQFHLSTQSAVSTEAGVRAARDLLHCDRVVLARELSASEIAACGAEGGIEIEAFVQGALCFCCSGRCLLSSWVGGRSGNRGACASPCRVGWSSQSEDAETCRKPLSMHDLCLLPHLEELARAGVASLKIEGRLKSAPWVRRAVAIYRRALDGAEDAAAAAAGAEELGRYAGRKLTDGYFCGRTADLTDADAGRAQGVGGNPGQMAMAEDAAAVSPGLSVEVEEDISRGTVVIFTFSGVTERLRIPPQRIANPRRAIPLSSMLEEAFAALPRDFRTIEREVNFHDGALSQRLLPRRCGAVIAEALAGFLRNATREDDGVVRLALPAEIRQFVVTQVQLPKSPENALHLGDAPNAIRIPARCRRWLELPEVSAIQAERIVFVVDSGTAITELDDAAERMAAAECLMALPAVCYGRNLAALRGLVRWAVGKSWRIEVNSWDALQLAREEDAPFDAGPGMAVLNGAAAHFLSQLGAGCVTASIEADREKLEALSGNCPCALNIVVFGHPALMTTRAILPPPFAPADSGHPGICFHDRRNITVRAWTDGEMTTLRPEAPFDWRPLHNRAISAKYLEADLCGCTSPGRDLAPGRTPLRFNYDRELR